ncbi:MAG: hypothetical protein QOG77_563 [Solirubrobacteraceae bacterium]|jgi:hypothetical protein|nr:hypothetical protein [Solirubrobacteraceae bacterium]
MRRMRRRWLLLGCAGVVWLGACGAGDEEPLSASCTDASEVQRALAAAPDPVVLADGTRLSQCIERATSPSDLQNLGTALTAVAEAMEDDPARTEQLGYLIGATRRGIERSSGTGGELAHRLERSGADSADPAALLRGVRAGEGSG